MRRLWQLNDQRREDKRSARGTIFLGNATVVLGAATVMLMLHLFNQPMWFMLSSRPHDRRLDLRILGRDALHEARKALEANYFNKFDSVSRELHWVFIRRFPLVERSESARCNQRETKSSLGDIVDAPDRMRPNLGMDWDDLNWTGADLKMACTLEEAGKFFSPRSEAVPNPLPPDQRLIHTSPERIAHYKPVTDQNLMLRYTDGCTELETGQEVQCPIGYSRCDDKGDQCKGGDPAVTREPACCVNPDVQGVPLFDDTTSTPTYVQAFSHTLWSKKSAREIEVEDPSSEGGKKKEKPYDTDDISWCSVLRGRCKLLDTFTRAGNKCSNYLKGSLALAIIAVICNLGWLRYPLLGDLAGILYALAGLTMLYAGTQYRTEVAQGLADNMVPTDVWGRQHIQPIGSEGYLPEITMNLESMNAEYLWHKRQAMLGYIVNDPENPEGLTLLWAPYLSLLSGGLALLVALLCGELFFTRKGASPLLSLLQFLSLAVVCVFRAIKFVIDTAVLQHNPSEPYWWHYLYPRAFTVGRWLPRGIDWFWDVVIMLPIHLLRACLDFASHLHICSPKEEEVLGEDGIRNKKMQSFMAGRRSHFVVTFMFGFILLAMNTVWILQELPIALLKVKMAAEFKGNYPVYRCNYWEGMCRLQIGDLTALTSYLASVIKRFWSIKIYYLASGEMLKGIIEWLTEFAACCCAFGALVNWTNFKVSRSLNIIGWVLLISAPVLTSFITAESGVRVAAEKALVDNGVEVWGELFNFFSQPCETIIGNATDVVRRGDTLCSWVQSEKKDTLPKQLLDGCEAFRADYRNDYAQGNLNQMVANATKVCEWAKQYIADGPQTRKETVTFIEERAQRIIDLVQGYTLQAITARKSVELLPYVITMLSAMCSALLMAGNLVPSSPLSSMMLFLPCGCVAMSFMFAQLYLNVGDGILVHISTVVVALGPLLYPALGTYFNLRQPLDDIQSMKLTTWTWWYVFVFTRVLPMTALIGHAVFLDWGLVSLNPNWTWAGVSVQEMGLSFYILRFTITMTLTYVATLQATTDLFVKEVVEQHVASHVPLVLQVSNAKREAELLQQRLGTCIELDPITDGTYIFGGKRVERDPVSWQEQTKRWAKDGAMDDLRALDVFAGHIKSEDRVPRILKRARASYLRLMLVTLGDPNDEQGNRGRGFSDDDWDPGDFCPGDVITLDGRRGQILSLQDEDLVQVRWLDNDEEEEVYLPTFVPTETADGRSARGSDATLGTLRSRVTFRSAQSAIPEEMDALHTQSFTQLQEQGGSRPGEVAVASFNVEMQHSNYRGVSAASAQRSINSILQEAEHGELEQRSGGYTDASSRGGGVPLLGNEALSSGEQRIAAAFARELGTSSRETQQSRRLEEGRPPLAAAGSDSEQGDSGSEYDGGAWSDEDEDETARPVDFDQRQQQGAVSWASNSPAAPQQLPEVGQLGFRPRSPSPPPRMPAASQQQPPPQGPL